MPNSRAVTSSAWSPTGVASVIPVTVTATPATLGALIVAAGSTIPLVADSNHPTVGYRYPRHVVFSSTAGNADSIYLTFDGKTDPQSTPNPIIGAEMAPGGEAKFEDGYALLENAINGGVISGTNDTAFRFVADGDTLMCVIFSD